MYYSVQAMVERGIYKSLEFFTFEEAVEKYRSLNRNYKKLFEHLPDGTRRALASHVALKEPFDYTKPIKDIYAIPNRHLKVNGDTAYVYFMTCVYQFKRSPRSETWNLVAIHGSEDEEWRNFMKAEAHRRSLSNLA